MTFVVLITGSRSWPSQDVSVIAKALADYMRQGDILRHGSAVTSPEASGVNVDLIAAKLWSRFGPVDPHPAEGHSSPLARNLYMIGLDPVPSLCLSFAMKWASGTGHCARHARKAGIHTVDFGIDTRIEARSQSGVYR